MLGGSKTSSAAHRARFRAPTPSFRHWVLLSDQLRFALRTKSGFEPRPERLMFQVDQSRDSAESSQQFGPRGSLQHERCSRPGQRHRVGRLRHRDRPLISFVSAGPFAHLCSGSRVPRMGQGQLRVGVRVPPNKWLQLTCRFVTPLAGARGAPNRPAAEPVC
jgi:hypothetical protein